MDNPPWLALTLLVLLDVYCAMVRTALVNASISKLNNNEQNLHGADATAKVLQRPRLRASFRLTLGITHFLVAGLAWWCIYQAIGRTLSLALSLILLVVTMLLLIALESLAERLPLHQPELWAIRFAPTAKVLDVLLTPFAALILALQGSTGKRENKIVPAVTEDELKTWVETDQPAGGLEADERRMIYSIFQFSATLCREIMVPRMDVLALDVNTSLSEATDQLVSSGHSRVPVYEENIDNVIGMLYAKDLLKMTRAQELAGNLRKLLRPAYFVPESMKVDDLLAEMQARGVHLAVVVDEFGSMAGVVTLEDIVEEIVGEIRDEYDQGEELAIQKISDNEYLFKGQVSLDDVNDTLNTELTAEPSDSLGGFIFTHLEQMPLQGDHLNVGNWEFTVEELHGQRINKIRACRLKSEQDNEKDKRENGNGTASETD